MCKHCDEILSGRVNGGGDVYLSLDEAIRARTAVSQMMLPIKLQLMDMHKLIHALCVLKLDPDPMRQQHWQAVLDQVLGADKALRAMASAMIKMRFDTATVQA